MNNFNEKSKIEKYQEYEEGKKELELRHKNNELLEITDIKPKITNIEYVNKDYVTGICLAPYYFLMVDF